MDQSSSMTGDTAEDFRIFRRTKVIYQQKKGGYSYDEAADFCRAQFAENGSLLVVVNTKASAKELYRRLKETKGAQVFHLSTNMCPQHRRDVITAMKAALDEKRAVICVTTQLIEAGVDISFGCVIAHLQAWTMRRRQPDAVTGTANITENVRYILCGTENFGTNAGSAGGY